MRFGYHAPLGSSRRIRAASAALVAGAVAIAGSLRWELPAEPVRERLAIALARDTGYQIVSLGGAAFTAFPWPVLQVTQLQLRKSGGSAETASLPLVKARLNLFSWLANDPKITGLTLFEPRIDLASSESMEETEAVSTVIRNYLRSDHRPALASLKVQSGEVTMDGGRWLSGLSLTVQNVVGNDLRLMATGSYRGQPLRLQTVVSAVGGTALRPISWDLQMGDLAAAFRGNLVAPPALDAEGRISVAFGAGALRSRPWSLSREMAGLMDGLSLRGEGRVALPQLVLREAVIERGAHRLQGALDATLSATGSRLAATLHAEALDVSELFRQMASPAGAVDWARSALWRGWLAASVADVRLSARRLTVGDIQLDHTALSAKLAQQRVEIHVSEARVGAGSVKGRAVLSGAGDQLDVRVSGQVEQVDLATALRRFGAPPATGTLGGQFALDGVGRTAEEIASSASGKGFLSVRGGEIAGIDLDRFVRRPDSQAPPPTGRTAFQQLDASWRLEGGVIHVADARIRASQWAGHVDGRIALPAGRLDLLARLWLDGQDPRRDDRLLRIEGTPQLPVFAPATPAHLRRS
ncbi:MAG: AsmA family protein [Beijerinckiaceae bacterium]